jgi:hypothetical protein
MGYCEISDVKKLMPPQIVSALNDPDIMDKPIKVVRMDGIESMSQADFETMKNYFNQNGIQVLSSRVAWGDAMENELVIHDGGLLE